MGDVCFRESTYSHVQTYIHISLNTKFQSKKKVTHKQLRHFWEQKRPTKRCHCDLFTKAWNLTSETLAQTNWGSKLKVGEVT